MRAGERDMRRTAKWLTITSIALLAACAGGPEALADSEPNNGITEVEGPLGGGVTYGGAITTSNDRDWYAFYVLPQTQLDIALTTPGDSPCSSYDASELTLRTSDGGFVADTAAERNETEHLKYTTPPTVTRYLLVAETDCEGGRYQFRLEPATAVVSGPGLTAPTATPEPNESPAQGFGLAHRRDAVRRLDRHAERRRLVLVLDLRPVRLRPLADGDRKRLLERRRRDPLPRGRGSTRSTISPPLPTRSRTSSSPLRRRSATSSRSAAARAADTGCSSSRRERDQRHRAGGARPARARPGARREAAAERARLPALQNGARRADTLDARGRQKQTAAETGHDALGQTQAEAQARRPTERTLRRARPRHDLLPIAGRCGRLGPPRGGPSSTSPRPLALLGWSASL